MNRKLKCPFGYKTRISDFDQALKKDINIKIRDKQRINLPVGNVFSYIHGVRWHTDSIKTNNEKEACVMEEHTSEVAICIKDILDNNIDALDRYTGMIVDGFIDEQMKSIYNKIKEISEKTGNIVNNKNNKSKPEQFIEMLERIEFGVNRDGEVSFPELHSSPGFIKQFLKELNDQGAEYETQVNEIIQRKSKIALEREALRKAKFPNSSSI